jgi:hypothetical protein
VPYATFGFDFPTSTGDQQIIDDLDFEPKGCMMIGGNQSTVGSLVTGRPGPGVFISLNGRSADGVTRSFTMAIQGVTNGGSYAAMVGGEVPVRMPADGISPTTLDYRASAITFTEAGFRLNVSHAASGRRPIHCIVYGDGEPELQAELIQRLMGGTTDTFPFLPTTSVVLATQYGSFDLGDPDVIVEGQVNGQVWMSFGGGHYRRGSDQDEDWKTMETHNHIVMGSSIGRQGFIGTFVGAAAHPVMHVISDLGPVYIEGWRYYNPGIVVDPPFQLQDSGGGSITHATALVWDGNGWTANSGATNTVPGVPSSLETAEEFGEWKAILFTDNNGSSESAGSTQLRAAYGVLGLMPGEETTYQGCVAFGDDGSFYQSETECAASVSTAGVSSSVGELDGDVFTMTTEKGVGYTPAYNGWGELDETPTVMQRRRYVAIP